MQNLTTLSLILYLCYLNLYMTVLYDVVNLLCVEEGAMKSCSSGGSGKKKMRMRGFMCRSGAMDYMVCTSSSVIVPRKVISSGSCSRSDDSLSSTCSAGKYMRLVESPSLNISESNQRAPSKRCLGEQPSSIASILSTPETNKDDIFQVVVMKVSIHCQGCAGEVKKHLSKMEGAGVTSFSIDVETKRVIVTGHVSPDRVLESLSKVKKAELWTL